MIYLLFQYETWFLELNPRGQVPILQDGMRVLPDSNRILEYLDDNFTYGLFYNVKPSLFNNNFCYFHE